MRVCVFIDGANFYYGLKSIDPKFTDVRFDFEKYINSIIEEKDILVKIFYYNGVLKRFEGMEYLYNRQQSFFKRLRRSDKFKVVLCKRQRRLDDSGREYHIVKGDDISLAVDMVSCIYEDICDKIILMSGDGDFEPAISLAKEKNKIVNIAYFEKNISKNIHKISNQKFLIDRRICRKYFYRFEQEEPENKKPPVPKR